MLGGRTGRSTGLEGDEVAPLLCGPSSNNYEHTPRPSEVFTYGTLSFLSSFQSSQPSNPKLAPPVPPAPETREWPCWEKRDSLHWNNDTGVSTHYKSKCTKTLRKELHSQSPCCLHDEEMLIHGKMESGVWRGLTVLCPLNTGWWANPACAYFHFDTWSYKMGTLLSWEFT